VLKGKEPEWPEMAGGACAVPDWDGERPGVVTADDDRHATHVPDLFHRGYLLAARESLAVTCATGRGDDGRRTAVCRRLTFGS